MDLDQTGLMDEASKLTMDGLMQRLVREIGS